MRAAGAGARIAAALALAIALAAAASAQPAPDPPPAATSAQAEAAGFRPLGAAPGAAPRLRVYLVRHAQAWKNVPPAQRPAGAQPDALTERGHEQARAAGRRLAGAGATRVVCSPAQRARQTAAAIADVLGLGAPEVSDAFRPLAHGPSRRAASDRWRTGNWRAGHDPRPDGGESLADGLARAAGFLETLAREAPGTTLVVVTHGEIAAALLSKAAGVAPHEGYEVHFVAEGAISDVAVFADRWELLASGKQP